MGIKVALHHVTRYRYDRSVSLSPHEVRLRPAPHTRTPILSYSLTVSPDQHFINWQQDPYGNYVARYVFSGQTRELAFVVDLVADLTVINPFDYFIEPSAEQVPFSYSPQLRGELAAYLQPLTQGVAFDDWVARARAELLAQPMQTTSFLVALNQRVAADIRYLVRLEPGVQTPEQTLSLASGSCRDSSWLLIQVLRHLGLAARFVSGYLIQLVADQKSLDGPSGPTEDFTDLHAWAEVYVPGAGWVGLDPTSGLMTGEGHIPLASTAIPGSAAPVIGMSDIAEVSFEHEMRVTRIFEDPRVTKPYADEDWQAIDALGAAVDVELAAQDVRLTQGGEPTFVSIDDMEDPQWNTAALGAHKLKLANELFLRLQRRFAPGALMHWGQGKWYPGEPLPRWALNTFWRTDGRPVWRDPTRLAMADAKPDVKLSASRRKTVEDFAAALSDALGLARGYWMPAFEDIVRQADLEQRLPANVNPFSADPADRAHRELLARWLTEGKDPDKGFAGLVLPLKAHAGDSTKHGVHAAPRWRSSRWPLRRERLFLVEGDSPLGMRLPLSSLPWVLPRDAEIDPPADPFEPRPELALRDGFNPLEPDEGAAAQTPEAPVEPREVIHTALCVEMRDGIVYIFMPPLTRLEDSLRLIAAIEHAATVTGLSVRPEGYPPPRDPRLRMLSVTPDPGVIEVNIHPSSTWNELRDNTLMLYEEARQCRLATEKFMLDGRHTGTGGGNHVTLGGATAADSPLLRRPDLLRSLITYWQNHPALSYLFSGTFIGPTSQAPRVDEARDDNLYELGIAFQQMEAALPDASESKRPWLVDRLLRHLLVDLTGNTHRAEFSIDKLYSPDGPTGRLGLVEFRAFEMPPHPQMSLMQMVLLRALVARFWREPYKGELIHWGTQLHDRWMLPHHLTQDIHDVARDLRQAGYAVQNHWFDPFVEFRFPRYGTVVYEGIELELRQAIEPWNVLGEEVGRSGTARYVDSSVERLQVRLRGMTNTRHRVCCNGRMLPLEATGMPGEYVAGVRFRAWSPPSALHPTIGVHAPLTFDIFDTWAGRSIGGCVYHVAHPGGRNYDTFPVNANEAQARRLGRFWAHGHTPGQQTILEEPRNPRFPATLDLRYSAGR